MKVVYNNPILELTAEEENILERASTILESICDKIDDFDRCESKCPIYKHCPHHHSFVTNISSTIHSLLDNIINEAERETE